jgi:asparagine synthase (glutamine-hydrolysing)
VCGIAGLLSFEGDAASYREAIVAASRMMARRGPDGDGLWTDGPHCLLAARRLAILDTGPAARQPMTTSDGRHALVFNGEAYGFRELRRELEGHGARFRSTGDTEVVLRALVRWGAHALERLDGMFALAFYDARQRTLLLARDHAGIKPLYVLRDAAGVLFASQFDQILAHEWARTRGVSPDGLGLYLRLGHIPAPHGLLEGAEMLEPGTWLEVSADGRGRRGRYYTFPVRGGADLRGEEAVEAIGEAVRKAVRRQTVSDAPVGTFLSGGIDSPLVAAEARRSGSAYPAFTLGIDDPHFDESNAAARYASLLGLPHHVRRIGAGEGWESLNRVLDACSDPLEDISLFPTFLLCEAARGKVKVLLSGDGGDDILWGYPDRQISTLRPFLTRDSDRGIRGVLRRALGRPDRRLGRDAGEVYRRRQGFVDVDWLDAVFPTLPPWPPDVRLFDFDSGDPDGVAQWLRWNEFSGHLPRVLLKVDRASMYHSLEVRVPLLDREVLATATRIDWRSCLDVDRGIGKLPLGTALARRAGWVNEGKRGFSVPMGAWLRDEFRPLVEERLAARDEILGLPLRRAPLSEAWRLHLAGDRDYGAALWRLLSLSLWEERHFAGRGRKAVRA